MSRALVAQTLALGDLLLTTPILAGLQKALPGVQLWLLADQALEPVARAQSGLAGFVPLPRGQLLDLANAPGDQGLGGALALAAALSESLPAGLDLVYNPCFNDLGGALTRLLAPRRVVGADLTARGALVMRGDWPNYLHTIFNPPA